MSEAMAEPVDYTYSQARDDHAAWLAERRTGIGGSDVAAILGLSRWKTPLDVYLDKRGELPPQPDNDAMLWGRILEPVILAEFSRRHGVAVEKPDGVVRDPQFPWMLASLDGWAPEMDAVVEVKTARSADGWGEPGTDEIPAYYETQVAHYLAVTGARLAFIPVLIGAADFRVYQVERDDSFIADLFEAERAFWHDHVLAGVPPEPINAADAARLWKRDNGLAIEVAAEVADDVEELRALKVKAKDVGERIESIEDRLKVAFRDAAEVSHGGKTLATFKAQTRKSLDTKALTAAHPDLAEQFRTESTFRVLRLK
jgi:putative phage-type endonuclease